MTSATAALRIKHLSKAGAARLSDYLALTKPGISAVVMMTTLSGFLIACGKNHFLDWTLLWHTLLGVGLVSSGAGTLNMLLESETDQLMRRTQNRPLPAGRVSPQEAFLLGMICASLGIVHLAAMVNLAASFFASMSLVLYLMFYTPLKKMTPFCTVIGAMSGALPPMIGWSAVSGMSRPEGWILFLILFFWQFPHLAALAWMYRDDYRRAGIQMVPDDGSASAKIALIFSLLLFPVTAVPFWLGLSGTWYLAGSIVLGISILFASFHFLGHRTFDSAKILFLTSVGYIPLLLTLMVLGR